jgi:hypothetical protein
MKTLNVLSIILLVLFLGSCGGRSDKAAGVSDKIDVDDQYEGADKHDFNLSSSIVYWEGSKVTGKHDGTINIKEGYGLMKDNQLIGGKAIIDMTTIVVLDIEDAESNATLKGHLESDDFFSTENHPESTFEIAEVNKEAGSYSITGNLTIKDITHAITFPVNISQIGGKYKATADFDIDRTMWDIKYGSGKFFDKLGDNMISDFINIRFEVTTM